MQRQASFLIATLGEDGAKALATAQDRSPELGKALVPRAILAWVKSAPDKFDGAVPGVDLPMMFEKTEQGYTGVMSVEGVVYSFDQASVFHVAACVAVSLGVEMDAMSKGLRDLDIEKLGKSLDVLVRARSVGKRLKEEELEKAKPEENAPAHTPLAPKAPEPPVPTAPPTPKKPSNGKPKLPKGIKKPVPANTLKVTKAESLRPCVECRRTQFHGSVFVGCVCMADLAKSTETLVTTDGYTLVLGDDWDAETKLALFYILDRR